MQSLYRVLSASQRGAALVAADLYKGNDFMGWRGQAISALRTPGEIVSESVIRALFCDLGGLACLAERNASHRLSNRPTLARECREARKALSKAYGIRCID